MGTMADLGIFGMVPTKLLGDERITPNALRAYIAISSFVGVKAYCYAAQEEIAERAGLSLDGAWRGIKVLLDTGWIARVRRGRGATNAYKRMVPVGLEDLEEAPEPAKKAPMTPQKLRTQTPNDSAETADSKSNDSVESAESKPNDSAVSPGSILKRSIELKRPIKSAASPEASALASLLLELRRAFDPGFLSAKDKEARSLSAWADDLDKLARIDKRPIEDIEAVIRWALADPFWSKNIVSGAAVRRQFDRLLPEAKRIRPGRKAAPAAVYDDWGIA